MTVSPIRRLVVVAISVSAASGLSACGASKATTASTVKPVPSAPATTARASTSAPKTVPTTTPAAATTVHVATPASAVATVSINTASDATLAKIPGMTAPIIALVKKGRPFASLAAVRAVLLKAMPAAQEKALEPYFSL